MTTSAIRSTAKDPLQPLIFASRGLLRVVLLLLLLATVSTVFGSGSVLTIGDDPICTTVTAGHEVVLTDPPATGLGLAARVSPVQNTLQLCQDRPSGGAQVLSFLTAAPELVLLLGFLAGVFLLARRARTAGLFSRPVARVVHGLGWYVLAGALLAATVQALAQSALVGLMVHGHSALDFASYWHVSIATLLAGAGILTIARMLWLSVAMQDDLDATI
jgi:hypothetical protein